MLEIRKSTQADIVALYGGRRKQSMKAITAVLDGEVVGITGLTFQGNLVIAFSEIKEELRKFPVAIYKAAMIVKQMIHDLNKPVFAVADPTIHGSMALLEHIGFEHVATVEAGEVYKWMPEQPQMSFAEQEQS